MWHLLPRRWYFYNGDKAVLSNYCDMDGADRIGLENKFDKWGVHEPDNWMIPPNQGLPPDCPILTLNGTTL